ncbi:MAG: hypothetical protein ABIR25_06240 [Sphingomicrobium sp.]
MANKAAVEGQAGHVGEAQLARVDAEGSSRHPHIAALISATGASASRDLADAVHLLCAVHGRHPGLTDLALAASPASDARDWLRDAADAFDRERLYLVRLTSAIGPMPSTPGAMQTENALLALRHAIETLAKSERRGCALGAAAALIQDWRSLRPFLDHAAERSGIECPACTLPSEDSLAAAVAAGTDGVASERALGFGAEQLLFQHRGLLDLMEARAGSREPS